LQNAFFQVLLLWEYAQKHVTPNASVKRVTVDVGAAELTYLICLYIQLLS